MVGAGVLAVGCAAAMASALGLPRQLTRPYDSQRVSQKATALAAATFSESTPWAMGMRTV